MADVKQRKTPTSNMHGFSGVFLFILDNALWGANAVSLGMATPLVCFIAFLFTGTGVFLVQKYMSEEDTGLALTKGFVVGTLAGIPTSIVGSPIAAYVVGKAGYRAIRGRS